MAALLDQVRTVVGEMMEDRGSSELPEDDPLTARFSEGLTDTLWIQSFVGGGVVVVYPVVDADAVADLRAEIERNGRVPLIVVALNKITPAARSALASEPECEVFAGDFFKTNRYRNAMVPEMARAPAAEVAAFLKAKRITEGKLARMHVDDPVARYFAAKSGEVFKFRVKLGYLQPVWRYRLVVPAT